MAQVVVVACVHVGHTRAGGYQGDGGVHDVVGPGSAAEFTGFSRKLVERSGLHVAERLGQPGLPGAASPGLGQRRQRDDDRDPGSGSTTNARPEGPVVPVQGDKCPGVEDDQALRRRRGLSSPSSSPAAASSSSVNAPCSASQSATTAKRPSLFSRRRAASASQVETG